MASNAIIQCSSSSSCPMVKTYDVFVSFRGEDTRNNFTGFLFEALRSKGIDAFKDDKDLKKGDSIAPELLQAIQGSRIFVVVFSKNYASSTWCLCELAEILTFIETCQRRILPIFYDVDPSEVRKQSGHYGEAFAEYEEKFKEIQEKMKEVQRWREALTKVANISGWHIANKQQYTEIKQIVQMITNALRPKFSCLPNDDLVGMQSRVERLTDLLHLGSVNDVQVVGISGMKGIGKSTVVRALYERISHQYDFSCFIDDVSKIYRNFGTLSVQKELLSQSLNEQNLEICNASKGTYLVWTRLRYARALIVFDNVDQVEQLNMFTGNRNALLRECLGEGSRIIIISGDESILRIHRVDDVYQVKPLCYKDAVELFTRNAFKDNYINSGYEDLTYNILSHAQGHPMAIQVLGSSLMDKNVLVWRSALARLRENKSENIMNVLRIGFDELEDIHKEIFLDIACFFQECYIDFEQSVKEILDFRGFHPEYGLQVLIAKSLIRIRSDCSIYMHQLLIDLGKFIVREKSPTKPRKWSRLWDWQDFRNVMSDNKAAENLEGIAMRCSEWKARETVIKVDALSKMCNLKLLKLEDIKFSGSLNHLSNELGYLSWNRYPFECLPQSFQANKLVELSLNDSNIKQLWEDKKPLHYLRHLNLEGCENLIKLPDFGEAQNLEWINLEGCTKLRQINPSVGRLRKLISLNLVECESLIELPHFGDALNLEILNLEKCMKLRKIDPSVGLIRKLTYLNLQDCSSLFELPDFGEDLNLETLNLKGCIQLRQINPSIGHLHKLINLNLNDCKNLVSLPCNILCLNSLQGLGLSNCSKLQLLDQLRDVEHLKRWLTLPLCLLPSIPTFPCMCFLNLSFCQLLQIPDAIGNLYCLQTLNLSGNNFATLPSFKELSKLYYLDLQHCKQLEYLPELPSRTDMPLQTHISVVVITKPQAWGEVRYRCWKGPVHGVERETALNIFNCPKLDERECCTSMAISWMIQIIQARHQCKRLKCATRPPTIKINIPESQSPSFVKNPRSNTWPPTIKSIVPGSEIPRWFNNQHVCMGNLITLDTSTRDNNCIGFVCCAVLTGLGTVLTGLGMDPPVRRVKRYIIDIPVVLDEDLVVDESDHLLLFYYSPRPLSQGIPLEMKIDIRTWKGFHFVKVKKYGYRWFYEKDLEQSNLTVMDNRNSSAWKHKLLTIEENK